MSSINLLIFGKEVKKVNKPNCKEVLPERLRAARKAKGLTLQQLGNAVYVSRQAISQYEHGKTQPTIDTLMRLSEALGVPMVQLVT